MSFFSPARLVAPLAVGIALLGSVAPADAAPARYEEAYVFGDSLSDPGNLFALTGQPGFPYVDGRFTNGAVWADYLAADFATANQTLRNYAFGLARVISPSVDPEEPATALPINLGDQVGRFLAETAGSVGQRAVGIVWMGANDAFRILDDTAAQIAELQKADPGADTTPLVVNAVLEARLVAQTLAQAAQALRSGGLKDIVLMNLPDLGNIPLFAGNAAGQALASAVTGNFNAALAAASFDGLKVTRIDMAGLFDALAEAPESFGVSNLLNCFNQFDPSQGLCTDPDQRAFFDLVHPNRVIHARVAEELRAVVAPLPLPAAAWLLLAGVGGLVVLRRRAT